MKEPTKKDLETLTEKQLESLISKAEKIYGRKMTERLCKPAKVNN